MAWLIALIGSIAGFLFGYDEGIIAGALPLVKQHFDLSAIPEGIMTSALPLGALFGSMFIGLFLSAKLTARFGRKPCLQIAALSFIIGAIAEAAAPTDYILTLSRFILGIAIGIAAVTTPLYLGESAPTKYRGAMIAAYQLAITIGILCAYGVNYIFIHHHAWRAMFASSAIPAVIMTLGLFFLPESPRWLLKAGRRAEAQLALQRLRGTTDIQQELSEINKSLTTELQTQGWRPLFQKPLSQVLFIGTSLFALQQLCGINVIIYYAPEIFKGLNIPGATADILATLGIGIVNMLVTLFALMFVDKIGRRKLLLFGFSGTCISLLILFIGAHYPGPILAYLSILCLTVYIIAFASSLGPIPYIIMAEIFPLQVRGAGMGLSSMTNWGFNAVMVFSFPILLAHMDIGWIFAIYGIICLIGVFFTAYFMPETKHLSLEKIEEYVMSGKPLNQLGKNHHER